MAVSIHIYSLFLLICVAVANSQQQAGILNSNVDRKLDLSQHNVKITDSITVENKGSSPILTYTYLCHPSLANGLSFIFVKDKSSKKLDAKEVSYEKAALGTVAFEIKLSAPLASGGSIKISVLSVYVHKLVNRPAEITQSEKQQTYFTTNLDFYSPYTTSSETITVLLASSKVDFYTKVKPFGKAESNLKYGPYKDKAPFSEVTLEIQAQNNNPFLTATHMVRHIEVSHWGNVAVEETINLEHTGAKLKGPFSRVDYQRGQEGNSIKDFQTSLPKSARDIYYRDEIGNVSTSDIKVLPNSLELTLRPRFPLFGGWKTQYKLGYNVGSWQYLFNKGNEYVLDIPFVDHLFRDQIIDTLEVKVVLPETASNVRIELPYEVEHLPADVLKTYLDVEGRPVVAFRKTKLVDKHIQNFKVAYHFGRSSLVREPLMVVGSLLLLFAAAIIYVRLDFTITKDPAKDDRLRALSIATQMRAFQNTCDTLYQRLNDAIVKFKMTKRSEDFANVRKQLEAEHKEATQRMKDTVGQVKSLSSDVAGKLLEVPRLGEQMWGHLMKASQSAESLVRGDLKREAYIDLDTTLKQKMTDLGNSVKNILRNM